jgi:hypothetical protein
MAGTCGNIRWPFLAKWRDGSNLTGTAANPAENDETSVEKMMMNQDQPVSVYFFWVFPTFKCNQMYTHTHIYIYTFNQIQPILNQNSPSGCSGARLALGAVLGALARQLHWAAWLISGPGRLWGLFFFWPSPGIHRVSICFAEYLRYVIGGVGFNASKETFQPSRNTTLYDIDAPILAQLRI